MMGKQLPNDMPNEQWGRGEMEMKGRWGLALCHEYLSRSYGVNCQAARGSLRKAQCIGLGQTLCIHCFH